jgi:hypothetical protein
MIIPNDSGLLSPRHPIPIPIPTTATSTPARQPGHRPDARRRSPVTSLAARRAVRGVVSILCRLSCHACGTG